MLNRVHHGHDPDTSLLAVAHGPQTVALWKLDHEASGEAEAADSRGPHRGRQPDLLVPTERSALRGLCFIGASTLLTVHVSGAVVGWRLPAVDNELDDEADDQPQDEPEILWELQLGIEPCAFAVFGRYAQDAFRIVIGGKGGQIATLSPAGADEPTFDLRENAHKSDITALAFSNSGDRLASAGRDRLIKLWDFDDDSTNEPETLVGCEAWPLCLSFSQDGSRLVSGCMDNGIYLWDLDARDGQSEDDRLLAAKFEHHGWIVDVAWSPDGELVAAASWDNTIGLYDADGLVPTHSLEYHRDYVSSLYFVPDSPYLISGSYDQTLGVWNWQEPSFEQRMHGHSDWVLGVSPLGDGQFMSLSSDKTTQVWSGEGFGWVQTLGESVASSFELGGDSGLIDFVDGHTASEDDQAPGGVRIEKPRDASRAVREIRRRAGDEDAGVKTPMRMLDKAVDEPETAQATDEALTDSGLDEAADDQLEAAIDEAVPSPEESAGADDQLQAALDEAADEQQEDPAADEQLEAALGDSDSPSEEPDPGALEASLDDAADDEHDDAADEFALQEFLDSVPDDLGLDGISSVSDMVQADGDELDGDEQDELDGDEQDEQDELDELDESEDAENPFAESPATQNIERKRIEETVSADERPEPAEPAEPAETAGESPEPSEPTEKPPKPTDAKKGLKNRLKFGLQKLKKRTQEHAAAKRAAVDPAANEPAEKPPEAAVDDKPTPKADAGAAADSDPDAMGREVSPSHVDLRMDRDVASVFDDLIPDPEEPNPPSLGADKAQPEPDEDEEDEEIVDEAFGNSTRLGMPSEVAGNVEDMRHHSTDDDDNPRPRIKRFRLGGVTGDDAAQKFLEESSGTEVSEPTLDAADEPAESLDDELIDDAFGGAFDEDVDDLDEPADDAFGGAFDEDVDDVDDDWAEWGDQLSSDGGSDRQKVDDEFRAQEETGLSEDKNTAARSTSLASEFATPPLDEHEPTEDSEHEHTKKLDSSSLEDLRTGVLKPKKSNRLSPGDSDASDLQIPEVSEATEGADGPEVIETQISDLWERRSAASAPGMGIIRRPMAADTLYKRVQEFDTPHVQAHGVDLYPKTKLVVSCGADNSVVVWGFDGTMRHQFHIDNAGLNDVLFSPDGTMLLAGGTDTLVHAWLIPQKTLAKAETVRHAVLDAHEARLSSLAISDNGKVLLSGSFDGTARAWHLPDGQLGATLDGEGGPVRGVAFEDKILLSAGHDGAVRVWNPAGLQIDQLDGYGKLSHLAGSPAGSIWGNTDGRVYVGDTNGARPLVAHDDEVSAVDLQKDGSAASAGRDGYVHLYTPGGDKPYQSIELPSAVRGLARASDYLAVATDDGKVYLYRRG